jgi:hypothetical protein
MPLSRKVFGTTRRVRRSRRKRSVASSRPARTCDRTPLCLSVEAIKSISHVSIDGSKIVESIEEVIRHRAAGRVSGTGDDVQLSRGPGLCELPGYVGWAAQIEATVDQGRRNVSNPGDVAQQFTISSPCGRAASSE